MWLSTRPLAHVDILITAFDLIGKACTQTGQPTEAITWHQHQLVLASQARADAARGDVEGQGVAHAAMGEAYQKIMGTHERSTSDADRAYRSAITSFTHALNLFTASSSHDNIITTQANLIDTHRYMHDAVSVTKHVRQMYMYQCERYEEMRAQGRVEEEEEDDATAPVAHDDKENVRQSNIPHAAKRVKTSTSQPKRAIPAALAVSSDDEEMIVSRRPIPSSSSSSSAPRSSRPPSHTSLISSLTTARRVVTGTAPSSASKPRTPTAHTRAPLPIPSPRITSTHPIPSPRVIPSTRATHADDDFTVSRDELVEFERRKVWIMTSSNQSSPRACVGCSADEDMWQVSHVCVCVCVFCVGACSSTCSLCQDASGTQASYDCE